MKGFKQIIATILLCITLFLSVFNSYSMTMTVQATEVVSIPIIQSLMALFGVSSGLGNQSDFWERASYFENVVNAAKAGSTYNFSDYGDVDFSDSESVTKWLNWSREFDSFLRQSTAVGGGSTYTASMVTMAKALDAASYKVSGTSATTAISNNIQNLIDKFELDTGGVTGSIQDFFGSVSGDNDNDNDPHIDWNKYMLLLGIVGSSLISDASKLGDYISALVTPDETVYDEYADSFADADGFSGFDISGGIYNIKGQMLDTDASYYSVISVDSSCPYPVYAYRDSSLNVIRFVSFDGSNYKEYTIRARLYQYNSDGSEYKNFDWSGSSFTGIDVFSVNIPIFPSEIIMKTAIDKNDLSLAENYMDATAYPTFKSKVGSAMDTLEGALEGFFDHSPSLPKIREVADAIAIDLPDVIGTDESTPVISKTFEKAYEDTSTDDPSVPATTNYTGILGKILAAIKAIGADVWSFFMNPMATLVKCVEAIVELVKDIVAALEAYWEALAAYLEGIMEGVIALEATAQFPFGSPDDNSGDSSSSSGGTVNLLNGLLLLVYILFMLLKIFLHLLEFIINIFKIPAAPGFITGDFATGFNYIKSVQLSPLNISVYDFLMGLIHILLIFSVVKTLKHHIDKIHL